MITKKEGAGSVAIKQALHFEFGKSFTEIAAISGGNRRTVQAHVMAKKGSKVAVWHDRKMSNKMAAIEAARTILNDQTDEGVHF